MCAYCVAMTESDHPSTTPIGALHEIVLDCADVAALSQFWQAVLGGERRVRSDGWATLTSPTGPMIAFQCVPEPKTVKNRLHLDVDVNGISAAAVRVVELGGAIVGALCVDDAGAFQVCTDPEGNEWCLVDDAPAT